ncbi:MAG: squalene synthase HpnC [bacterium]|nr:squalene synthase HpnC [bacterium]
MLKSEKRGSRLKLRRAQLRCIRVTLSHYENFFVLGPLTPLKKVPHLAALYAFCRHADDIADESGDPPKAAVELNQWQEELISSLAGEPHHPITRALAATTSRFNLPQQLYLDLLSAFRQDLTINRYATFADLRAYTRLSADPVGRLVLRLYGYDDPELDALSDSLCTGLQLANFCQDIGADVRKDRLYIPVDECMKFDVDLPEILDCNPSPRLERLLHFQIVRAYKHLKQGLPLAERLKGKLKLTVRLFAAGGLQILENLERNPLGALASRPKVTSRQKCHLLFASLKAPREKPPVTHTAKILDLTVKK